MCVHQLPLMHICTRLYTHAHVELLWHLAHLLIMLFYRILEIRETNFGKNAHFFILGIFFIRVSKISCTLLLMIIMLIITYSDLGVWWTIAESGMRSISIGESGLWAVASGNKVRLALDLYIFALNYLAYNTVATTWPSFQATQWFVIAILQCFLWLLNRDTET